MNEGMKEEGRVPATEKNVVQGPVDRGEVWEEMRGSEQR